MPTIRSRKPPRCHPKILIFDVDGVLVDVRWTFWLSALQTVRLLTGKRVGWRGFHEWKAKSGNNDDWTLVSRWATALGRPTTYGQAREAFQKFYWGANGKPGNVAKEKLLVSAAEVQRWSRHAELNLFTGRTRREFLYTFEKWPAAKYFRKVVTQDDVKRKKPDPEGLLKIVGKRDPREALYLGDNIDDALAARAARVPFIGIVPPGGFGGRERGVQFRELGALTILPRITKLSGFLRQLA